MKNVKNINQAPRPTLGVVAISYNEECDLPYFLSNLLPWVDEIVIVDDGSTDRTAEIAKQAGSKVKFVPSPRNKREYFSHQRNKGIDLAKSDWLLHMDIDERIPTSLVQEIDQAIRDPNKDGYRLRRLNFFLHRPMHYGGWQRWNMVHLARHDVLRFGGKMHETCELDVPSTRIGQLNSKIWHLNDESYNERLSKSQLYTAIEAENLIEKGRRIHAYDFVLRPCVRFAHQYLLEAGFLDGTFGLILAIHSAQAVFRAYVLAWERQNLRSRKELEASVP